MKFLNNFFNMFKKDKDINVLYMQVVDKINDDILVLNKISASDNRQINININDLPENTFKCSAYKITIEPIEHTFNHPCEEWKKQYKPEIIDVEERKKRMKAIFGIIEDEE